MICILKREFSGIFRSAGGNIALLKREFPVALIVGVSLSMEFSSTLWGQNRKSEIKYGGRHLLFLTS